MAEQYANNATTTLASGITAGALSLTVAGFALFPLSAPYRIIVDAEIMIVTAGAGTLTWTVTRGSESTSAVAHSAGAIVAQVLTVAGLAAGYVKRASATEDDMVYLDTAADTLYLGGSTNAVRVAKGGEMTLVGTATRWEDLRIEPTVRGTGANNPSFEQYLTNGAGSRGVYLYSFSDEATAQQKEVFFSMQMPHQWAGTSIKLHVHWIGNVSDTTAAPVWGLEYSWADIGALYGNTSIVYTDGVNYTAVGTDANVTALTHYLSLFAAIAPGASADGLSSILIGRLFRYSGDASDTYNAATNKCGLLYVDAHYEVNDLGSASEYVK